MKNNINKTLGCPISSEMEESSCLKSTCCISTGEAIKSLKSSSKVKRKDKAPTDSTNYAQKNSHNCPINIALNVEDGREDQTNKNMRFIDSNSNSYNELQSILVGGSGGTYTSNEDVMVDFKN